MSTVKPLHLAKSLTELNKLVDTKTLDGATPKGLCRSADKLLLRATSEILAGDQELAYILYMRFVDVVKAVTGSKEYKKDKTELSKLLPTRRISEALTKAESLSSCLEERYAQLNEDQVVPISELEPVSMATSTNVSKPLQATPPPLTPTQLYTLLTSTPTQVLVIDCRPRASYNASHPDSSKYPQWLSIPEEAVLKGLTERSAEAFLRAAGKVLWREREKLATVVMIDEASSTNQSEVPILALRDALTKWSDGHSLTPPNPYILDGGYNMWYLSYPVTTVGHYKPSQRSGVKEEKVKEETSQLSYPTLEESFDLVNSDPSSSDPSSVSIDMDEAVTIETPSAPQPNVAMDRYVVNNVGAIQPSGMDMYLPSFPVYALPPAPLVPLSLEGESELLAPSLSEEIPFLPIEEEQNDMYQEFGIVSQHALIDTPFPGGHAPLFYQPQPSLHYNPQPMMYVQPHPEPHPLPVHAGPDTNRVINGPVPNPPSYEQSHSLPPLAPVQPPLPPPVSANQFNQAQNQSDGFMQSTDTRDARIRELEERLASTERAAQESNQARDDARKAQEGELLSLRELVNSDRAKLAEDTQRKQQEVELARAQLVREQQLATATLEAQRRALAEERERMTLESRQVAAMKIQFEREQKEMSAHREAMRDQVEAKRREEQQRVFSLQSGLPGGWEKRLDSTNGRFYYVDHETKTTHWNPPTNWINYQRAREAEVERRQPPPQTPPQPTSTPPTQPISTPPTQPTSQPPPQPATAPPKESGVPSVDRAAKPSSDPTLTSDTGPVVPDRSKKPVAKQPIIVMTPAMKQQKQQNLQAVFGTRRHVLTGLRNLGNTCYMNSTLQCLACTSPVIQYFISGSYQQHINHSNPLGTRGQIAMEFAWLMKALWSGGYKSVSPRDFKDMIGQFVPQMKGNDQQDSQEFLAFLLDGLHEDMNKVMKKVYIAEGGGQSTDQSKAAQLAWENHLRRNDSIIVKFFQGMFRSSIRCIGCGKSSVTFEPFMYLSLPIPPGQGSYSLEDCIKMFIKTETVEWNCPNCKDTRGSAVKKMDIWRLPPVLLIHLKRFSYQGLWREKRQNTINYPAESALDMTKFVAGSKGYKSFSLYSVSNHYGTLTGGHYTACCRNPYNKAFYNFDDHEVKEALPRQVKSAAAYILYYSAVDLTPAKMSFT